MINVFISYSHIDRGFVSRLAQDLEMRIPEAKVFYDVLLPAGSSWAETLSNKIEAADVVLAILSADYLSSEWAKKEIQVAMLRATESKAKLIPVMLRSCIVTGFLSSITWVDFRENYDAAFLRLMWGITGERLLSVEGVEPGSTKEIFGDAELDMLKKELKSAVNLFKSRSSLDQIKVVKDASIHGKCFIVMPFGDPNLEVVYEDFIKPTIEKNCGLLCERGDDVFGSNIIMDDILESINSSKIVLADLTQKNANVFYEVGICHASSKPVLLLAQSIDDVPFDLRHRRVLLYDYTPRGCKRLEASLKENVLALLEELK